MESPEDYIKLTEPELYLRNYEDKIIIIDEVQLKPEIFPILRSLVDRKREAGRFIILGSASPDLIRDSSESLAGRIVYIELYPFNLSELENKIDLVLIKNVKVKAAIEIKNSNSPRMTKGNTLAIATLKSQQNFIITPSADDYFIKKNVRVCSIKQFINTYLPEIIE